MKTIGTAQRLYEQGRYEDALTHLQGETEARALLLKGRVLHQLSRHEEAATVFQAAAEEPRLRAEALAALALALVNTGRQQEALGACDEALTLEPAPYVGAEALKNKCLALLRLAQVIEADAAAARSLELRPDYPEGHMAMGLVRMMQMQAPEAERHLLEALKFKPAFAGAWANLGFLYRRQNRLEEAVVMLSKAVEARPTDHVSRNNLALAFKDLGRLDEAEAEFTTAIAQSPATSSHRLNLAALHRERGRLEQAIAMNKEVLEQEPDNKQAGINLPSLLLEHGNVQGALQAARAAVERFTENATSHYNLAVVLLHARQLQEAEREALDALRLGLDQACVHLCLSQARNMMERHEQALESALVAMGQCEDARSHFTAAMAFKGLGRLDKASEHFKASIKHDPDDAQGASAFLAALDEGTADHEALAMSSAYVKRLFDQYAGTYDSHLRERLEYRGPEEFARVLAPHIPEGARLRVLDLGCGTGLCAPVLREVAAELHGCDLSANMVRKAMETGLYDDVQEGEANAWLLQNPSRYDLVAAGDVLVYVGELAELFSAVHQALGTGGLFVFSAEAREKPGCGMGNKGRYSHSACYLREQASRAGFEIVSLENSHVRCEEGTPVPGFVSLLRRL